MNLHFLKSAYGVAMPGILYGTAWKQEHTASLVEQALRQGFRGIDTACQPKHYHEAGVGEGIVRSGIGRSAVYLQTKFTPVDGQDPQRMPYDPKASLSAQVAQSFQTSLNNLQTDYLDCLVLHSPLANARQLMEVWQAMELVYHKGGAKQLGISNFYDVGQLESLYRSADIKPAVLQNRFYASTGYDKAIRAFCAQHQIIYESFWTLTANPAVLAHLAVQGLAQKYQRTHAQIFFRFLNQSGIIPLTGTTSEIHMREDLAIFEFELTAAECAAVDGLLG